MTQKREEILPFSFFPPCQLFACLSLSRLPHYLRALNRLFLLLLLLHQTQDRTHVWNSRKFQLVYNMRDHNLDYVKLTAVTVSSSQGSQNSFRPLAGKIHLQKLGVVHSLQYGGKSRYTRGNPGGLGYSSRPVILSFHIHSTSCYFILLMYSFFYQMLAN